MSAKSDALYGLIQNFGSQMINKAMNESNQEVQVALNLLQNEQNLNTQYKSKLLEAGLKIPGGNTEGFEQFVENAGDSDTASALGTLYMQAKLNNEQMIKAFNDYNTGVALGDSLRAEGYAARGMTDSTGTLIPDADLTQQAYMFNEEELDFLTSGENPKITKEQLENPNFMRGVNLSQTEALKMIEIDSKIAQNKMTLQEMERIEDEKELERIVNQKNELMALTSSIITDRLELKGINISYFKDIGTGENADLKIDQFQELVENIHKQFPALADEIVRAMNIYAAPESMAHTRHHGFIQMGINQYNVKDKLSEIEHQAYSDPSIRQAARLEIDPETGQLTEDSVKRLTRYYHNNKQYEYGELAAKYNDYTRLGLHLDEHSLEKFQNVMKIEDELENKRLDFIYELLGTPEGDLDTLDLVTAADWRAQQNLMIDDLYNTYRTGEDDGLDDDNPFKLNYTGVDSSITEVVSALDKVDEARAPYSKANSSIQGALRNMNIFGGNMDPQYIPTKEEVIEMAQKLSKRITRLNEVGRPSGPFGLYETTEEDVASNQKEINRLISIFDEFILQYENITGLKLDLHAIRDKKNVERSARVQEYLKTLK